MTRVELSVSVALMFLVGGLVQSVLRVRWEARRHAFLLIWIISGTFGGLTGLAAAFIMRKPLDLMTAAATIGFTVALALILALQERLFFR